MTGAIFCHLVDRVADSVLVELRTAAARADLTRDEALAAIKRATPGGDKAAVARVLLAEGYSGETVGAFVRGHPDEADRCSQRMVERLKEGEPALKRLMEVAGAPARPAGALPWRSDVDAAMSEARASGRPLMLRVKAPWSLADLELDRKTFADPEAVRALRRFVLVEIDEKDLDDSSIAAVETKYLVRGLPTMIVFDARGREVKRITEYVDARALRAALATAQTDVR
jgi:hypothetical protein